MRRGWAAAALLALAFAGCGGGDGDGTPASTRSIDVGGEPVPVSRLQDAATALCTARDQARGDVKAANATFYDRSHDALHTLARALDGVDRTAAARLLEDKERVEADLRRDTPNADLAADLDRLAQVTRTGLAALSVSVPPCP